MMNLKIVSWNVRGLNNANDRRMVKDLLFNWKADIVCLQETKLDSCNHKLVGQLKFGRWTNFACIDAVGTKGGIISLWDKRDWAGSIILKGSFSITIMLSNLHSGVSWSLSGVYAPTNRVERNQLWSELVAVKGLYEGPWVICGDFNTTRFPCERKHSSRFDRGMREFSEVIEELNLIDPPLFGGKYTWSRNISYTVALRIDRFLFSSGCDNLFGVIKQSILPRIVLDHCPLILECGQWVRGVSYLKFENMWMEHPDFEDLVNNWWHSFVFVGIPDFVFAQKLKQVVKHISSETETGIYFVLIRSILIDLVALILYLRLRYVLQTELRFTITSLTWTQ